MRCSSAPSVVKLALANSALSDTKGPGVVGVASPQAAPHKWFETNLLVPSHLIHKTMQHLRQLGVRGDLEREWGFRDPDAAAQTRNRVRNVTAKAWRFAGEMDEIAATFEMAGMPSGFFVAAAEVYGRMAGFKDADERPPLEEVLAALMKAE